MIKSEEKMLQYIELMKEVMRQEINEASTREEIKKAYDKLVFDIAGDVELTTMKKATLIDLMDRLKKEKINGNIRCYQNRTRN